MKKIWTSVLALCVIVLGIFIAAPFAVPQIALASPSFATIDAAGLIQRISNLEDRVSALEAQLSTLTSMSHTHPSTSQLLKRQHPKRQAQLQHRSLQLRHQAQSPMIQQTLSMHRAVVSFVLFRLACH